EVLRSRVGLAGVTAHGNDANYLRTGTSPANGRLIRRFGAFKAVPVTEELYDGQLVDVGGGLRVVHTPGHTPGHVSLVHERTALLITGDAIWNMTGHRSWPLLALCTDVRLTLETAAVLGELEYDTVAFTHGP